MKSSSSQYSSCEAGFQPVSGPPTAQRPSQDVVLVEEVQPAHGVDDVAPGDGRAGQVDGRWTRAGARARRRFRRGRRAGRRSRRRNCGGRTGGCRPDRAGWARRPDSPRGSWRPQSAVSLGSRIGAHSTSAHSTRQASGPSRSETSVLMPFENPGPAGPCRARRARRCESRWLVITPVWRAAVKDTEA